jgi:hypothetical protein
VPAPVCRLETPTLRKTGASASQLVIYIALDPSSYLNGAVLLASDWITREVEKEGTTS